MPSKKQMKEDIAEKIDNEGFDYYFRYYGPDMEVLEKINPKLPALVDRYIETAQEISDLLGLNED